MLVGSFSTTTTAFRVRRRTQILSLQIHAAIFRLSFHRNFGEISILTHNLTFETNTGTFKQEMRFIRDVHSQLELFRLSNDPFDQERFQRRVPVKFLGRVLWFPTAEDVMVMKVRWARGKDRPDIKNVLTVQRGKLDWPYIEKWCRAARHACLVGGNPALLSLKFEDDCCN